eukprot:bmy_01554T0
MAAKELHLKRGDTVVFMQNYCFRLPSWQEICGDDTKVVEKRNEYDRRNKDSSLYPNIWNTSTFIINRRSMIGSKSRLHSWVHSTSSSQIPPAPGPECTPAHRLIC